MFDYERIFRKAYNRTDTPEKLPWHEEGLPPLLDAFLEGRPESFSILDLGSGTGVHAVEMARRGHDVVGVDVIEEAVEMSRRRADDAEVDVNFVCADAMEWDAPEVYDIVVDSGMIHGFSGETVDRYNDRLLERIAEGGNYFLSHFVPRHRLDWRPVGPNRRSTEAVQDMVPDVFSLRNFAFETIHPPFPVGPTARMGHFWFEWSR